MIPIINLILPDNDQLSSTNFYACYEFIIYEKRELERSKTEDTNIFSYKIKQDIINKILP